MKNRSVFLITIGLCSLLASIALANLSEIPAPTFDVGETWEYKNSFGSHTRTIKEVRPDGILYTQNNEPNAVFMMDKNLTRVSIDGVATEGKGIGWKFIEFPMTIGKSFTYKVNSDNGTLFTIEVTAKKVETIKVGAGSFEAVLLESCWKNEATRWEDCGMKHWYAPAVKTLIKRKTPGTWAASLKDKDFELVKYVPAQMNVTSLVQQ